VEHLLRRITGTPADDCRVTLPVTLVPRHSTSTSQTERDSNYRAG
jgi:DNA-binding LacI/PurR family transcriptional regulator